MNLLINSESFARTFIAEFRKVCPGESREPSVDQLVAVADGLLAQDQSMRAMAVLFTLNALSDEDGSLGELLGFFMKSAAGEELVGMVASQLAAEASANN